MWPKKRNKIDKAGPIVAKSDPLQQAVGIHRYGSLVNINPLVAVKEAFFTARKELNERTPGKKKKQIESSSCLLQPQGLMLIRDL